MRREQIVWLVIIGCGFGLRVLVAGVHGLEGDDAFSLALSRLPLAELVPGLLRLQLDVHPPLHFLLLKGWTSLAGDSLLALRLMNILLDTLTGALLVRLVAWVAPSGRGASMAALLWGMSPLLMFGGWLVRMYTLLGLWVVLGAVFTLAAARSQRFTPWMLAAAGVMLAALYTHILGAVAYTAVGGVLLVVGWRRSMGAAVRVIAAFALVGLLYLPFALPTLRVLASGATLGAEVNPANALAPWQIPGQVITTTFFYRLTAAWWMALLPIPLVGWLLRGQVKQAGVLLVLAMLMYIGLCAVGVVAGLYKPRYVVAFAPLLIAVVALAIDVLSRQHFVLAAVMAAAVLVVMTRQLNANLQYGWRDDWLAGAAFVTEHTLPGDAVLVVPDWGQEAMAYHYPGAAPVRGFFPQITLALDLDAALGDYVAGYDRVWLVRYQPEVSDPDGLALAWLQAHGATATTAFPAGMQITLFDAQPVDGTLPLTARPLDVQFGKVLALRGVTQTQIHAQAVNTRLYDESGRVLVALHWEPLRDNVMHTPRVRLTDTFGQVYGGALDPASGVLARHPVVGWQPGDVVTVYYDLNLNPQTPPGPYNIEVMVLDDTGAPINATGADAGAFWAVAGQVQVR
jgi:mannosyltransferase